MEYFPKIEAFYLNYNELEKLINNNLELPKVYEFLESEFIENGSFKLYENVKKEFRYIFEKESLNEFLSGKFENRTRYGLIELCRKDIIPDGNYLIEASW